MNRCPASAGDGHHRDTTDLLSVDWLCPKEVGLPALGSSLFPSMSIGPTVGPMKQALWFPLFGELAEPGVVARLSAEAEEFGWDGVFVWDHLFWRAPVTDVGDPTVTLAAMAAATERIRFGPMVSPVARRHPVTLARETVALDRLSAGRLILGVGLGSDRFAGEFSRTGGEVDDRRRAERLDETLEVLTTAWSGREVDHHGRHLTVDRVRFRPGPLQTPGIPVWVAGFPGNAAPIRRAVRYQGYFPVNFESIDQFAALAAQLTAARLNPGPFDLVAPLPVATDPRPYQDLGATWRLIEFEPDTVTAAQVRGVLRDGPIR